MNSNENLPSFQIDYREFLKGENSYDDYPDGGFISPADYVSDIDPASTVGVNIFNKRAFITTPPDALELTDVEGSTRIIAWGKGNGTSELMSVGIDGGTDGNFYSVNVFTGEMTLEDTDTTNQYYSDFTDVAFYTGDFYTTSATDITQSSPDLATNVFDYWTNTLGMPALNAGVRHPMEILGDILYIADGNLVHQNDNGNAQYNVLDIPEGFMIDAMIEYKSLLYIAARNGTGVAKVFTWDGIQDSWINEYEMDDYVTCFKKFQGVLYAFRPFIISYFDGTKFKTFRPLAGGGIFGAPAVGKFQVATIWDSMMYIESEGLPQYSNWITRYGKAIVSGKSRNIFTRYISDPAPGEFLNFNTIFVANFNTLFAHANTNNGLNSTSVYYDRGATGHGLDSSGTRTIRFRCNTRSFSTQVTARKLVAHFENIDEDNGDTIAYSWMDDKGNTHPINIPTTVATLTDKTRVSIDINNSPATREITLIIEISGRARLKLVQLYYQGSEVPVNS